MLLAHHDTGRAQHLAVEAVALLEHLDDGSGLLSAGGPGHDRFMPFGIEALTRRLIALDSGALEDRPELLVDEADSFGQVVGRRLGIYGLRRGERALEVVEHRQE